MQKSTVPGSKKTKVLSIKVPLLAVTLNLLISTICWGQNTRLSPELQGGNLPANLDVIIQYRQTPGNADDQNVIANGGRVKGKFQHVKGGVYNMPSGALQSVLANNPNIAYISPDRHLKASLDQADVTIGANLAPSFGLNGSGIGVAVIDSGIAAVDDLRGKVVYHQLFNANATAGDLYGHGTHVAGILAGSGRDSTGWQFFRTFHGVAEGVNLLDLQVLDQNGEGTDSATISAIEQAIALREQYNIRVINLSLGRPVYESYTLDPLCQAVEQAWNAGITVVVAAGNYGRSNPTSTFGYGTITAPGNDPYVITVGAMNDMGTPTLTDDVITTYSSKGPTLYDMVAKPDIVAPGNLIDSLEAPNSTILTTDPQVGIALNLYENTNSSAASPNYIQLSGTSMATPFASATVALMLQQHPGLTPDQIKARLMKTADKNTFPAASTYTDPTTGITYHERYDIFTVGAGYLNVANALMNTDVSPSRMSAMSPTLRFNTNGTVGLVDGQNVVWGTNVIWGTNVVWGTNVIWGTNVVWATGLIPAASDLFLQANNVIWGTNTVSGANVIWGSNVVWGTAVAGQANTVDSAGTVFLTSSEQ